MLKKLRKASFSLLSILLVGLGFSTQVQAGLVLRGADTLGNRLIYDDDLDVTWYDYSKSPDNWYNQLSWAANLSVTFGENTYTNWRLPISVDGPYSNGYDGSTTTGYNITTSELGHLFYTELGNKGWTAIDGTWPQPGWGLSNTGDFQNLINDTYWSETPHLPPTDPLHSYTFSFNYGYQSYESWDLGYRALALRPGNVFATVVPVPSALFLMCTGLASLGLALRKRRLT